VDYALTTGRMPLVVPGRGDRPGRPRQPLPGAQPIAPDRSAQRHAPAYDTGTIRGLVAYVGRLVADGGPSIPTVGPGDVAAGGVLYRESCAACHSWSGEGGALLHREAPPLQAATPVQVAEAVRTGPGQMPAFGTAALTDQQLDDLTRYVAYVQQPDDRGGLALGHVGPVAEGAVGLLGLALLLGLCVWIGDRA
ncbi:MAG: cytochrome c class, partial [Actinomycetia bacterium]|nr:cytochrome c class [Actinomycetes bacterium]